MSRQSVSVVIPTYNRRERLALALASVLQQTRPVDEIIVIDDGSTDGTRELLDVFALQHANMPILVIHQENRGPSAARNAGIKAASGDLIAFLDDDDAWLPHKMERQLSVFASSQSLALLGCASDVLKMGEGKRVVDIGEWSMIIRNRFPTSSVVARREVLLACGGFPEDMRTCEDYALWLKVVSGHRCAFLNEVLVSYAGGKPGFGHSGLSADLNALHAGELDALSRWGETGKRGVIVKMFAAVLSSARHLRRRIVSAWG